MIMPYSVSKTALLGLTKALSYELAPDNIRVNCIAPGIIDTKFAGAVSCFRFFLSGSCLWKSNGSRKEIIQADHALYTPMYLGLILP